MVIAKNLKKMALPGMTFGGPCVNLQAQLFLRIILSLLKD